MEVELKNIENILINISMWLYEGYLEKLIAMVFILEISTWLLIIGN